MMSHGHYHTKNDNNCKSFVELAIHEFAHNFYQSPHVCGANSVIYNRLKLNKGWGMMSGDCDLFFTANAWELWWNGWLNGLVTVNKADFQNGQPIEIPLCDFVTERQALRVEIPYSKESYIWFENHQKINAFDDMLFCNPSASPSPGIYAYVTDRFVDQGNPCAPQVDNLNTVQGTANRFTFLEPNGNFDYLWDGISYINNDCSKPLIEKGSLNLFGGVNEFQSILLDGMFEEIYNDPGEWVYSCIQDNRITFEGNTAAKEDIEGPQVKSFRYADMSNYNFPSGFSFGINSHPVINNVAYDILSFDNGMPTNMDQINPVYLNGLKIEIVESSENCLNSATQALSLLITYDDWTVNQSNRWTGWLAIPENETLSIIDNSNIVVDLSGIANSREWIKNRGEPLIKNFVKASLLELKAGSNIYLENNSCLVIKEESKVLVEGQAQISVNNGSLFHIKDNNSGGIFQFGSELNLAENSILHIDDNSIITFQGSNINLTNNSKIIIENGAQLILNSSSINAYSGSSIEVRNGGILTINQTDETLYPSPTVINLNNEDCFVKLGDEGIINTTDQNVKFNFNGYGYLLVSGGDILMDFDLQGMGETHHAIQIENFASLNLENYSFSLTDLAVTYESNSSISTLNNNVYFENVHFKGIIPNLHNSDAFKGSFLKTLSVINCSFNDLHNAINIFDKQECQVEENTDRMKIEESNFEDIYNIAIYSYNLLGLPLQNSECIISDSKMGVVCEESKLNLHSTQIYNVESGVSISNDLFNSYSTINNSEILNCSLIGVSLLNANMDINPCSYISNNEKGIEMISNSNQSTVLSLSGVNIQNNTFGIIGENFVLEANVADNQNITPNGFEGNSTLFDLCLAQAQLNLSGNYWGTLYNICGSNITEFNNFQLYNLSCNIPVQIISDSYLSQPFSNCFQTTTTGNCEDDEQGLVTVSNTSLRTTYDIAVNELQRENYYSSLYGFNLIKNIKDQPIYDQLEEPDKTLIDISDIHFITINEITILEDCLEERLIDPASLYGEVLFDFQVVRNIINIYPNPVNNEIHFNFNINENYVYEIHDTNYKLIKIGVVDEGNQSLSTNEIDQGFYFINLTNSSGEKYTGKFVKIE